jgi:uncharacterized protein YjbI with pentapeptide repeats
MSDAQRYSDPLSPERQAELQALLDAWAAPAAEGAEGAEPARRASPFTGMRLTGADVAWLAQPHRNPKNSTVPGLHLEGADLRLARLESADLRFAHLEGVDLWRAHLEGAFLYGAHLEDASLYETHLESAGLFKAHLQGARLLEARLESADLVEAHLEGARLNRAHLEAADLTRAHLEGRVYSADDADLARLRAVNPAFPASLPPTDLRGALLDDATVLRDTTLCAPGSRAGLLVGDTHWSGASLGALDWTPFTSRRALLGDERAARDWRSRAYTAPEIPPDETPEARQSRTNARRAFKRQQRNEGIAAWARAARANEQIARALRSQGLGDEADHFAYRAQVTRRGVLRRRGAWLRWLAAGWLDLVAGYGYRFGRALALYLAVIAAFTGLYLLDAAGSLPLDVISVSQSLHAPLAWYDALALSVAAFHGRGFVQLLPRPGDLTALLIVLESLIGLFIELGVIAAFVRRYLMGR